MSAAFHRAYALDGEGEIGVFCHNTHFIGLIHQINQRIHRFVHLAVVKAAHVEEVVLEGFRAHAGELAHAFGGVAQDHPARLFDADIVVHFDGVQLVVRLHSVLGDVGKFVAVVAAAHADVAVHLVHERRIALSPYLQHFVRCAFEQLAFYLAFGAEHKRHSARGVHRLYEQGSEFRPRARNVDPHLVALLYGAGVVHEIVCKNFLSVVMNHILPPDLLYPNPHEMLRHACGIISHMKNRLTAVFPACLGWGPRKTYVLWGKYYSSAKYLMVRTIWEV